MATPYSESLLDGQLVDRLERALNQNAFLREILGRFDELSLPDGWLTAGAVAQTVWNIAHARPAEAGIKDIDIVYFDAADLSAEAEAQHEARLRSRLQLLPVRLDVKNEARVHLWYESVFGYPIRPYASVADAIATFPTTATCVAVRRREGVFECYAPFDLGDLFAMIVRPNKRQITEAIYNAKIERWRSVWPQLTIRSWNEDTAA